jgi:hypothetical protein
MYAHTKIITAKTIHPTTSTLPTSNEQIFFLIAKRTEASWIVGVERHKLLLLVLVPSGGNFVRGPQQQIADTNLSMQDQDYDQNFFDEQYTT